MDQAKWCCPRNKRAMMPKVLSGLQKPKFKIQGCWLHSLILVLWIIDCRCPSDSSMVVETTARTIQYGMDILERKGKARPDQLILWVSWLVWGNHARWPVTPSILFHVRLITAQERTRTRRCWNFWQWYWPGLNSSWVAFSSARKDTHTQCLG